MKENDLLRIIGEHVAIYKNCIARELESSHDQLFDDFGFPMFGNTSSEYREQVYYSSYLESYTRILVNSILKDIFDEECPDNIYWPEFECFELYNGYTNVECEQRFGFSFINYDTKVGYRYSDFREDEIDSLLRKGNINAITLIIWENKNHAVVPEYKDKRVQVILMHDMLHELLYELDEDEIDCIYNHFVENIALAVKDANNLISLETLPGFTPSFLHKYRSSIKNDLVSEVKQLSCFYVKNKNFKYVEENSRLLIRRYDLIQYFLSNKIETVFVGTSNFAKCFITSEYLYNYFENNPM